MKPGDLVTTQARHGFITLFAGPPGSKENSIAKVNMGYKELAMVLAIVNGEVLLMLPRLDGYITLGWRESQQFKVVS